MSTNRKTRAALLFIALVSCLAMTACGASKKSAGGLTPNITIPSTSASASASPLMGLGWLVEVIPGSDVEHPAQGQRRR